ncbi:hypothetical protein HC928_07170 [bacterium]|nr:hypothetical protein [bacterium]
MTNGGSDSESWTNGGSVGRTTGSQTTLGAETGFEATFPSGGGISSSVYGEYTTNDEREKTTYNESGGEKTDSYEASNAASVFESQGTEDSTTSEEVQGTEFGRESGNSFTVGRVFEQSTTTGTGKETSFATTITNEEYNEHSVANSEAIFTEEQWSEAIAQDTDHAANLSFGYRAINTGTDNARRIEKILFNIYIGDDPQPISTYASVLSGDTCTEVVIQNLYPGDPFPKTGNSVSQCDVPLTLEQLRAIDLGAPIRIIVADYNYGDDESFYENAWAGGVLFDLADTVVDPRGIAGSHYLIASWGDDETYQDVIKRYFDVREGAEGRLEAIEVPVFDPNGKVTRRDWKPVSNGSWWTLYLSNYEDAVKPFHERPAVQESRVLMRFDKDTDTDGFSDAAEARYLTNARDLNDFPDTQLVAGFAEKRVDDTVTVRMAFENPSSADAYGIEAIAFALDDSITINTYLVGGTGRVPEGARINLGAKVGTPDITNWNTRASAEPISGGQYTGDIRKVFTFTPNKAGVVGVDSGLKLNWTDTTGRSGSLDIGDTYDTPFPLEVADGVTVGLGSGEVSAGKSFTVVADISPDAFSYTINYEPYTPPAILVSYNEPKGNHKFITPVKLTKLDAELLPAHAGQMLPDPILTLTSLDSLQIGQANTLEMVFNNPLDKPIESANLILNFITEAGENVLQQGLKQDLAPGPNVVSIEWNTSDFDPPYDADTKYKVLGFVSDISGIVIDTDLIYIPEIGELPLADFNAAEVDWNFGTVKQGAILGHVVTIANTGDDTMRHRLTPPREIRLDEQPEQLEPSDSSDYRLILDTRKLPAGNYSRDVVIKTSDPAIPAQTVQIRGTIAADTAPSATTVAHRPLDVDVTIPGNHDAGEVVEFAHPLNAANQTLHPVQVLRQDESEVLGMGQYAVKFGAPARADVATTGLGSAVANPERSDSTPQDGIGLQASLTGVGFSWDWGDGGRILVQYCVNGAPYYWLTSAVISPNQARLGAWKNFDETLRGANGGCMGHYPVYTTQPGTFEIGLGVSDFAPTGDVFTSPGIDIYTVTYHGNGNISVQGPRQIRNQPPNRPTITGPGNNATLNSTTVTFRWADTGDPDNWPRNFRDYYPQVLLNGQPVHVKGWTTDTSWTVSGLQDETTYVFWVQSGDGLIGSSEAATIAFRISLANQAPNVPTGLSPTSGHVSTSAQVALGWQDTGDPDNKPRNYREFELQYRRVGENWQPVVRTSSTNWTTPALSDGTYEWQVRAFDGNQWSAFSGVSQFQINLPNVAPNVPQQLTPADNAVLQTSTVDISWQDAGDPDNKPNNYREFELQYRLEGTDTWQSGAWSKATTWESPALTDGVYEWRVRARDGAAESGYSSIRRFTIDTYIIEQVATTPFNRAQLRLPEKITGGETYRVQYGRRLIWTNSGEQTTTLPVPVGTISSATLKALVSDVPTGKVQFRVDIGNDGTWDWTGDATVNSTFTFSSPDLAEAFQKYVATLAPGTVNVPVKVSLNTSGQVILTDFTLISTGTDIAVEDDGVSISSARITSSGATLAATEVVEGATIALKSDVNNPTSADSGPVTVAFYAVFPDIGQVYIDSVFFDNIPAGESRVAEVAWDTAGYTGPADIRVQVDPFNRLGERNEQNNTAILAVDVKPRLSLDVSPGDCNADVKVDIADITSIANELYDGDGVLAERVSEGSFVGHPKGCDANEDAEIAISDIICTARLTFKSTCSPATMLQSQGLVTPEIQFPRGIQAQSETLTLPLQFSSGGYEIAGLGFQLHYDPQRWHINQADHNDDGLIDSISLPANLQHNLQLASVNVEAGIVSLVLADISEATQPLPNQASINITFTNLDPQQRDPSTMVIKHISFSSIEGGHVPTSTEAGTIRVQQLPITPPNLQRIYLPLVIRSLQ